MEQIVVGKLRFYHRPKPAIQTWSKEGDDREWERFLQAQRQAVLELAALYDRAASQVGEATATIFSIHAILAEDEDLVDGIHTLIREEKVTAEYAVWSAEQSLAETFAAMDSPYMQARAADIRDVSRRLMRYLMDGWEIEMPDEPCILVSDRFLPSEVMRFDRNILGLISRKGSLDSHTAQLLQAYHIPALVGVKMEGDWDRHLALMDGHQGKLYLDPEPGLPETLRKRYQQEERPELCLV